MINKFSRIKFSHIFYCVILLTYFVLMSINSPRSNLLIYSLNAFVVIFSGYNLFVRKNLYPFSLYKLFYLFSLFFFGLAPLLQFKYDSQFFGMGYTPDEYYVKSYFSLIIFLLIFDFCYFFLKKKLSGSAHLYSFFDCSGKIENGKFNLNTKSMIILGFCFVISFFIILYLADFSISNLTLRGKYPFIKLNQSLGLFIANSVRPFGLILFLFYYLLGKNKYYKLLLFILTSFIILPTATPRYMSATLYIAILVMCCSFLRKDDILSYGLIGGILYIFPFLSQFRYLTINKVNLGFDSKILTSVHFDSFFSYMQITNHEMITWGKQLSGTLFFFVPRSIWPEKPIGSGHYYSEQLGADFNNLAVNYFAEGYINFGYIGVLIFTLLLAYYCVIMDTTYWNKKCYENKNGFTVLYFLSFGLLFFILRGDLMASFAYALGVYSVVFFITCILKCIK